MWIVMNDTEIDITNLNTDFVDYWLSTVFKFSNTVPVDVNNDNLIHLKKRFDQYWNNLTNTLYVVNDLIDKNNLPNKFKYTISNTPSTQFLESTHEQWAAFSKAALEKHIPAVYDAETFNIYEYLNTELATTNMHTDYINNMVHDLELLYRHMIIHQMRIPAQFTYRDYIVKPSDTRFGRCTVVVPYRDIGRPQYEKWGISRHVIHSEISNYDRITNYIDFYSTINNEIPDPAFITQCNNSHVQSWGNVLGLGIANYTNSDVVGYDIINALTNDNHMCLKK